MLKTATPRQLLQIGTGPHFQRTGAFDAVPSQKKGQVP
jgi:hypothetical protein